MPEQETATLESLSDLRTPWLIHVAATLRIADHIAAGVDQIDALAAVAGCDRYALHRALTSLADKGVFEETAPVVCGCGGAASGCLTVCHRRFKF